MAVLTHSARRDDTTRTVPPVPTRRKRRGRGVTRTLNGVAVVVAALFAFPIYWMINTSFKSANEYQTFTPHFLPQSPTVDNYTSAVHVLNFGDDLINSIILTLVSVSISLVVGFLGALAIARFRFHGRKSLIFVVMMVQRLPMAVMILPMYKILAGIHQTDSLWGVVAIYIGLILPYMVWTLRGFIVNVPKELDEAALVDGCSRWQTFYRIILPLVGPGLVATSLYGFIQIWNEWLVISTINRDNTKHNLMMWLTDQTTLRGTAWGPLMASAVITSLPVVAVFLLIQRHIATGLTAGAVKG
jgi:N,N'-diacetylchitobiose transport system permease protein